jgi:hypothetical protein
MHRPEASLSEGVADPIIHWHPPAVVVKLPTQATSVSPQRATFHSDGSSALQALSVRVW